MPRLRLKEAIRDARVVLQNRGALRQRLVPNEGKLRLVSHVRGRFEVSRHSLEFREERQKRLVQTHLLVGQVDREGEQLVNRSIRIRADMDFDASIAPSGGGPSAALDNSSILIKLHVTIAEYRVVRAHQQVQNRQEEPVGYLTAKLPVHLAGDKEAAIKLRVHCVP